MTLIQTGQNIFAKQKIINCPNFLSALRLLISFLLYPVIAGEYLYWAFLMFMLGAATDLADGIITRRYGQINDFEKILDSAADKVFFLVSSYLLIPLDFFWWWLIILGIEWKLLLGSLIAFFKKGGWFFKLGSNNFGKNKMFAEMVLVVNLFLSRMEIIEVAPVILHTFFVIIVLFAVFSFVGHLAFKKPRNKPFKTAY